MLLKNLNKHKNKNNLGEFVLEHFGDVATRIYLYKCHSTMIQHEIIDLHIYFFLQM